MSRSRTALLAVTHNVETSLNFFFINFWNICCLRSNFQTVEHHLSSINPHILFLTKTQLSEVTDSSPLSLPSYFLYSPFRSKSGCCVSVRDDLTCSHAHALESSQFSTVWFRLNSHSLTKLYVLAISSLAPPLIIVKSLTIQLPKWSTFCPSILSRIYPSLEISMFTTIFGFRLPSLAILVN
ncbi:hypothetical protein E2C01_067170 [Portunus trituberculatus]|uniref:Uncharacterized protein n=1 Tax=Portunus trituberculatus TaxID=210409 RepID=A0A5B7HSX2_PORTR|nr:hypothetical protein [Portunus trituberculatus]